MRIYEKVIVGFYAVGVDLDPQRVHDLLQLDAARMKRRGELRSTAGGTEYRVKNGAYSCSYTVDENSLEERVVSLSRAIGDPAPLLAVAGLERAWIDLFLVLDVDAEPERSTVSIDVSPRILAALGDLKLPVQITVAKDAEGRDHQRARCTRGTKSTLTER